MRLYLIRHGISEDTPASPDAERALTPKGKARILQIARGLRNIGARPDLILTSPLRRAAETAELMTHGLAGVEVREMAQLAPGAATPEELRAALAAHQELAEIALVGHQPGLGKLVSFLLTGSTGSCEIQFKKGSVACLQSISDDTRHRYNLVWLLPPRVLREI